MHDRARTVDLGQQDGVGRGGDRRSQILTAPGRIDAIDANDEFAPAKPALARRGGDLASGATESSRSRMIASAARLRALAMARGLDPGM